MISYNKAELGPQLPQETTIYELGISYGGHPRYDYGYNAFARFHDLAVATSPLLDITPWKTVIAYFNVGGHSYHATNTYFRLRNASGGTIYSQTCYTPGDNDVFNKDWSRTYSATWDVSTITGPVSFYGYTGGTANTNAWASMNCGFTQIIVKR